MSMDANRERGQPSHDLGLFQACLFQGGWETLKRASQGQHRALFTFLGLVMKDATAGLASGVKVPARR